MDSLTQIVLGGAVGEVVLGKKVGNKAILWGAIAGTIPDLDVFIGMLFDTVTKMEMHRGFSHSILFSVLFAPIFGWLVWRLYKKREASWKGWSMLMFWCLFTHPLLDAHTSWGTQLFWPLPYKVAYNNIFVVDPLYTVPFLVFLILAMTKPRTSNIRRKLNWWGIGISSSYMVLTIIFKLIAVQAFETNLQKQHISYSKCTVRPAPLTSLLWTANIETPDSFLTGYYSLLDTSKNISFNAFYKNHEALGEMANEDKVKRLIELTKHAYTISQKDGKLFLNDLRFGQMGFEPESDFVFQFELKYENGELFAFENRKEPKDAQSSLGALWQRIKGI